VLAGLVGGPDQQDKFPDIRNNTVTRHQTAAAAAVAYHKQVLGGLVGGPDQQDKFPDIRNDYQRSEVAMDFNAGFTGAAAGLAAFDAKRKTRTCSNHGTGGWAAGGWARVEAVG
jgi:hypothetical protein